MTSPPSAPPHHTGVCTLIVPGWRGSGPDHWQSHWATAVPGALRVEQDDWQSPRRRAWVQRLADTIAAAPGEVIVVAHSLGCIATAHLPPPVLARIGAALLVAPADAERRPRLADFAPVPRRRLPFASLVVASDDDPYCPPQRSRELAESWGSAYVLLPGAGHINVDSGHRRWTEGLALLAGLQREASAAAGEQTKLSGASYYQVA
mgnify:CR=1 FL=1